MWSSSVYEVATAANWRSVVILFSAYQVIVVDPILDQNLAALAFSVMCRCSIPTKAPRATVDVDFIDPIMLLMSLIRSSPCLFLPDQRSVGFSVFV